MTEVALSVNIDHVATVREARRAPYPDPVEIARLAEEAGAQGITLHLRGDRRHVQDHDLERLRDSVRGKLNLEVAIDEAMLELAIRYRPDQVTLVPERPDEVTTEGGLQIEGRTEPLRAAAERLGEAGIAVSVFVDPDPAAIERLGELGPALVPGFEINTDRITQAWPRERDSLREPIRACARRGAELGFQVFAGHGLTTANVSFIAEPPIEELNIGHFLVARSLAVGMGEAVREMLAAMRS